MTNKKITIYIKKIGTSLPVFQFVEEKTPTLCSFRSSYTSYIQMCMEFLQNQTQNITK